MPELILFTHIIEYILFSRAVLQGIKVVLLKVIYAQLSSTASCRKFGLNLQQCDCTVWPWQDYAHLPHKVAHVSSTQPSLNVYKSDYMSYQKVCECFNIFTGSINSLYIIFFNKNLWSYGF